MSDSGTLDALTAEVTRLREELHQRTCAQADCEIAWREVEASRQATQAMLQAAETDLATERAAREKAEASLAQARKDAVNAALDGINLKSDKARAEQAERHHFRAVAEQLLLAMLSYERRKFTQANEELMREMVDELVRRGVYPTHWPEPDVHARVRGWGARWHEYDEPHHCPHCNADLCDRVWGPPGKREIGHSDLVRDRIVEWHCPDCGKAWPR